MKDIFRLCIFLIKFSLRLGFFVNFPYGRFGERLLKLGERILPKKNDLWMLNTFSFQTSGARTNNLYVNSRLITPIFPVTIFRIKIKPTWKNVLKIIKQDLKKETV